MKPKRYIMWSSNKELDLNDKDQRKVYIEEVLTHGKDEDISSLDWDEIRHLLPQLNIPQRIRSLWENYFASHA